VTLVLVDAAGGEYRIVFALSLTNTHRKHWRNKPKARDTEKYSEKLALFVYKNRKSI